MVSAESMVERREMDLVVIDKSAYSDAARLLHSYFKTVTETQWVERFQTWWDKNPSFSPSVSRGWGIRENGKLVGFFGNIPFALKVGDSNVTAVAATTWFVESEFRGRGRSLGLLLEHIKQGQDTILFNTSASTEVASVLEKFRFQKIIDQAPPYQSWVLTDPKSVFESRLKQKGLVFLASPISSFFRLGQQTRLNLKKQLHYTTKEISNCGKEFDDLWERTKNRYSTTVVRTSAVLNWYCFSTPILAKTVIGAYEHNKLVAFIILGERESDGYRTIECLDYWGENENAEVVSALFKHAFQFAMQKKAGILQFTHFNASLGEALKQTGMFTRTLVADRRFYSPGKPFSEDVLKKNTYLSYMVGDHGL